MTPRMEREILQSEVAKFYDGKTVLITGAAGFVGSILLEILLRCCPGIRRIYILLRAKRGIQPDDRKEAIFKKEIFSKIKDKYPDVLEKVTVIAGDVSDENLGMNDDDFHKVAEDVSIVFHVAASINFFKPLRFILIQNVVATHNIIEFCRKLKRVDGLVYTSTAFSNCNRQVIYEMVYKMPFKAEDAVKTIRNGSDEELKMLFDQCTPPFPNFYTFSKCIAENLLLETAADFPVSIVRPSIVGSIWKGSLPGYVEEGSGVHSLSEGVGKGFIRVLQLDKDLIVDHVPADIVGNTHILAAWLQVTERLRSPSVYNCTTSEVMPCTWKKFCSLLMELADTHPIPNSYQTPALKLCKSNTAYWFHSMLDHYLPAVVIDTILRLSGRKPRLFKLYRFYDKMMSTLLHFRVNEWKFSSTNFQSLPFKQNVTDYEIFHVDIRDYNFYEMVKNIPNGAPLFKWNSDKKSYEERIRITHRRYLMTSFIKWAFIGFSTFLCCSIIF